MNDELTPERIEAIVREAMRESPHVRRNCWKRRMAFTVVVMGTLVAVGHIEHIEPLTRGWEFLAACATDKLIFGIAEV